MYFTMFILGYEGMPRRFWSYLPEFQTLHRISTSGTVLLVTGLVIMFYNLFHSVRHGKPTVANPWGGVTLEWHVPSPPPHENFEVEPIVTRECYDFEHPDDYGLHRNDKGEN